LIPGRVQSSVHATFLSLFLNGEELEMNLFRHFVAAFMSSTGKSPLPHPTEISLILIQRSFLAGTFIDWGASVPKRYI